MKLHDFLIMAILPRVISAQKEVRNLPVGCPLRHDLELLSFPAPDQLANPVQRPDPALSSNVPWEIETGINHGIASNILFVKQVTVTVEFLAWGMQEESGIPWFHLG